MFEDDASSDAQRTHLSLIEEQHAAEYTALLGRTVALLLIAPLITYVAPWPAPLYVYGLLSGFVLFGWVGWKVSRSKWAKPWHPYAFVSADFALLTFALLYPNPLTPFELPSQFVFRFGSFIYFFILLAGLAYLYRPMLVLWGGFSAAVCWTIGVACFLHLPDTVLIALNGIGGDSNLEPYTSLTHIDLGVRLQEVVLILIVSGLLALAVQRSRAVAVRQASLASERANLARYFPNKTAEMLAGKVNPFSEPSEHNAAILFADLVSFTAWSQAHTPTQTIELLREVHGVLTNVVFKHDGTLDKFIGDGLMATFGTPEPTKQDASKALAAAIEMADAFQHWQNTSKLDVGKNLNLAIGVHFGSIVIGDIGSNERLEFAVLGDAVNVASRLEAATRESQSRVLISNALVDAAKQENKEWVEGYVSRLEHIPAIELRGRTGEIDVMALR